MILNYGKSKQRIKPKVGPSLWTNTKEPRIKVLAECISLQVHCTHGIGPTPKTVISGWAFTVSGRQIHLGSFLNLHWLSILKFKKEKGNSFSHCPPPSSPGQWQYVPLKALRRPTALGDFGSSLCSHPVGEAARLQATPSSSSWSSGHCSRPPLPQGSEKPGPWNQETKQGYRCPNSAPAAGSSTRVS